MRWGVLAIVIAILVTAGPGALAQGGTARTEPTLVLAELFTSEGCSSCPPADHLLETLAKEQPVNGVYVVALSEHVTYWDHQGWKDPFGSNQFTNRQTAYGRQFNLESIYTPQLIIDGVSQFVGSDAPRIQKALTESGRVPKPKMTVAATWKDGEISMTASGPGVDAIGAAGAELWWAVAEDDLVVDVKRGENASRTLHHSGVVRLLRSSAVEKGAGRTGIVLPFTSEAKREHLRVVAFAQSKKTRQVISIGWARVKED